MGRTSRHPAKVRQRGAPGRIVQAPAHYVEANHPPDKLERLAVELDQLTGSAEKGRIAWRMSQIALRRHPA